MIALLLSLALAVPADPDRPEPKVAPAAEVQDLVLLHEEGPVRVRMRISNGDRSVFGKWHEHMERWFKYVDRDSDGTINAGELERLPTIQQMQYMLTNGQFFAPQQIAGVAGQGVVGLQALDLDGDGKIDRHEFLTYFAGSTAGPLQVMPGYNAAAYQGYGGGVVSDALFRTLDVNKDGNLSREELARASSLLARFDTNDDEIIGAQELVGGNLYAYQAPQQFGQAGANLALVPLPRESKELKGTGKLKFAKDLLSRLDTDRNGGLQRKEFRIPAADFEALDANRDGQLDALDLVKWLTAAPELEIVVRMDTLLAGDVAVEVTGKRVEGSKTTANGVNFRYADASIQFDRNAAAPNRAFNAGASLKQYYVQIFTQLDTQKTGKVALAEVNKNPQAAALRTMGKWLDMDGDAFITLKEIEEFIELTSGGAQAQIGVGFLDQGRGLFEILDTQADGQLSIGELRGATRVLATYIKEGKDGLARTDIPRRYQIVVASGNNGAGLMMQMPGQGGVMVRQPRPGQLQAPARGPSWFQKMDVNGDGYVSPREFLGPMPIFKPMDLDGDGLISHEEAGRYDEEQKAKKGILKAEPILEAPADKR